MFLYIYNCIELFLCTFICTSVFAGRLYNIGCGNLLPLLKKRALGLGFKFRMTDELILDLQPFVWAGRKQEVS